MAEAMEHAVGREVTVPDVARPVAREGLALFLRDGKSGAARPRPGERGSDRGGSGGGEKSAYAWRATVGVAAAVTIAAFTYWYARKAPCLVKCGF
ncbi:unnamed protein product [Urochloa humidicola]